MIAAKHTSFIVGNPPFLGYTQQNKEQKADMALIYGNAQGTGVLDYVTAWYVKAFAQMKVNPQIKAAFVSTNSITQGEQVSVLWQPLFEQGLHIHFAHRTFKWSNEGSGVAAVHCVIVGFGMDKPKKCDLWDYTARIAGDGKLNKTRRINAYLVDAPSVWINKIRKPLCKVPEMSRGSQPTDGGKLLLNEIEKETLLAAEPDAKKWIRSFMMGEEFINNKPRYCLWLDGISQKELDALPLINERVEAVKAERLKSTKVATQNPPNKHICSKKFANRKSNTLLCREFHRKDAPSFQLAF